MVGCNSRLEPNGYRKKNCLYIYSVHKMILKFDLKFLWWNLCPIVGCGVN